jgi:hypothetical protein
MQRVLVRGANLIGAMLVVGLGMWMAYLGQFYYFGEQQADFSTPLLRTVLIFGLIAASIISSLYAGYRLLRRAISG